MTECKAAWNISELAGRLVSNTEDVLGECRAQKTGIDMLEQALVHVLETCQDDAVRHSVAGAVINYAHTRRHNSVHRIGPALYGFDSDMGGTEGIENAVRAAIQNGSLRLDQLPDGAGVDSLRRVQEMSRKMIEHYDRQMKEWGYKTPPRTP